MKRIIGLMLVMCIFLSMGVVFPQEDKSEGVEDLWKIAGFENDGDLEVAELKESTKHDQDGKITVSVNTDGNVKYKHGKENEKREFKNIEEGSNFTFENGKLVEANFKTKGNKATKYRLGNYEYTIPAESQVTYKIGKENEKDTVIIIQPAGSVTKPPEIINSSLKKEVEVEIKTDGTGVLKIPQGNVGAVEESGERYTLKETSLFYGLGKDGIRMYTKEKYTTFFTEDNKQEFTIINLKEDELDLVFDNQKVDAKRSSVLVTKDEIGSINLEGEGAIISIASDNRLGIGKGQLEAGKKTLSYQGKNGYAVLGKGIGEDNPLIRLQGASLYGPDNRVFLGDADRKEFYYKPGKVIEGVKNGDGAIAINAKLYDKDNKPLPYVILTTNENSHLLAPEKDLKGPEKYIVGPKGVVFSANAAFNQLTPAQRKAKVDLREGVNSMDAQTHRFVNRFRMRFRGGTNLKWDPKIAAVSLEHSKLMASRGYIGHYGFDGRLRKLGGSGSENVAMFGDSQKYSAEEVGRRFSQMWIDSPGHMRNMLGRHTKTGIGVYMVERSPGYYEYYATQIFQ